MPNSDPRSRECSLAELPRGISARVVSIAPGDVARLAGHGIHAGTELCVEGDAPFRGPRIIRVGTARLALARGVAVEVRVAPRDGANEDAAGEGA